MITTVCIFVVALAFLVFSSDKFIEQTIHLGRNFNVSEALLGLTVVAVGTSLPEMVSSILAVVDGVPGIALGNVIGSNICNISLILALTALVAPFVSRSKNLKVQGLLMVISSALVWLIADAQGSLGFVAGAFMLSGYFLIVFHSIRYNPDAIEALDVDEELLRHASTPVLFAKLGFWLLILIASSEFLVRSAVTLATLLGLSEAAIALSLIALGTSLPELSVSVAAARKKAGDIIIGNLVGSNLCNLIFILGLISLFSPLEIPESISAIDLPLAVVTSAFAILLLFVPSGFSRLAGLLLLSVYTSYVYFLLAPAALAS